MANTIHFTVASSTYLETCMYLVFHNGGEGTIGHHHSLVSVSTNLARDMHVFSVWQWW